jgi:protein-L-isoaspartate O-methyltransferase
MHANNQAPLSSLVIANVTVVVGDGSLALPERAPYDGIIVAAEAPVVPEALVAQLAEGGRLVQPLGTGGNERVTAFVKRAGRLLERAILTDASFVPPRGRGTRHIAASAELRAPRTQMCLSGAEPVPAHHLGIYSARGRGGRSHSIRS